jgi:hypothetical protein
VEEGGRERGSTDSSPSSPYLREGGFPRLLRPARKQNRWEALQTIRSICGRHGVPVSLREGYLLNELDKLYYVIESNWYASNGTSAAPELWKDCTKRSRLRNLDQPLVRLHPCFGSRSTRRA